MELAAAPATGRLRLTARRKNILDRALSLVTDVKPGEGLTAILLASNVFCLLASYYVLKTVRESLILSEGGAEVKSYAAAGQALLLLLLVPAYGAFASRVNRMALVSGVTLFFASHLLVFYLLVAGGVRIGVAFFLWLGIFNLVVVAQFWAFANDVYSQERGKRLFPVVGLGSSAGALVGAQFAGAFFAGAGPGMLLLLASAGLVLCVAISLWVHRRECDRCDSATREQVERPLGKAGGFRLVLGDRYLLFIALLVTTVNVVNTVGEFLLGKLVVAEAGRVAAAGGLSAATYIGQFYGGFYAWVNLLGLVLQAFVVSRVFKRVGIRGSLFVLPAVASLSYGLMAFVPVLAAVAFAKTFENATDYSVQNTARHALFLPTSREAKYKAKQAIDSFFWRAGDLLQAAVVLAGVYLAFGTREYAMLNLVFVVAWFALVIAIGREYRRRFPAEAGKREAA